MNTYTIESYVDDIINQQEIYLEVRAVRNMLYIEKLEFMKENMATDHQLFFEMIQFPYIKIDRLEAKLRGSVLRSIHSRSYPAKQKQVIYVVWIDKNKNIIKPETWLYHFAEEGDIFTVK